MRRKILSQMILGLLLTGTLVPLFNARQADARTWMGESGGKYLGMSVTENVTVLQDGSANLSILMNIPSSPLADMYRKMLEAPSDAPVEQEMKIPENVLKLASDIPSTEISVPVKEEFVDPLMKEQLLSLGLKAEITESSMVPRGSKDEIRISLSGHAGFEVFSLVQNDSNDIWNLGVGPFNKTGITGLMFSRLIFTQLMLGSIEGDAVYGSTWLTRIILPTGSHLLNSEEFIGDSWQVDFGGGTFLRASVAFPLQLDGTSTFLMREETFVTKNGIIASSEELHDSLSNYKAFNVSYSLPRSPDSTPKSGVDENVNTNWDWTLGPTDWIQLPGIHFSKTIENETKGENETESYSLKIKFDVTPRFRITQFIGWQFSWHWDWPPIQTDWFKTTTKLEFITQINFTVNAKYCHNWSWPIYEKHLYTFKFYFGVPVWIDVRLGVDVVLKLEAEASLFLSTTISNTVTIGVEWNKNVGWKGICKNLTDPPSLDEILWGVYAGVTVTPSVRFRLEFLFYSAAGPYVELEPYVKLKAEINESSTTDTVNLSLTFGCKVNIGVKFEGWIKDLLKSASAPVDKLTEGLDSKSDPRITIYEYEFHKLNTSISLSEIIGVKDHDLSIANVSLPERVILVGEDVELSVIVRNDGDSNETSDVKFFQDDRPIPARTTIDLSPGDEVPVQFVWNTRGLSPGTYLLKFEVANVTGENNLENNFNVLNVSIVEHNDVAVTEVTLLPKRVHAEQRVKVTVTLQNLGNINESINLTAFLNETAITPETTILIFSNETKTINLSCLIDAGVRPGQLLVPWANISMTHYDTNVTNNLFYGRPAQVKAWDYIFEDEERGTILKIDTTDSLFQFTTPDKNYGVRTAVSMHVIGLPHRGITIIHSDNELAIKAIAVDTKTDFCLAVATDVQTHIRYMLADKPATG